MAVQTFNPTDLSQSATNWAVAQRIVGPFAPHAQLVPNLTLALDPGCLLNGTTLTEVGAQSVGPFVPPSSGFRIDRVVIDRTTGAASIVTGTVNSLTPPAIPDAKMPIAQVQLLNTSLVLTNSLIVDERVIAAMSGGSRIGFRADLNGVNQPFSANTLTLIAMTLGSAQAFNTAGSFDPVTHRFKPTVPGLYQINAQLHYWSMDAGASGNAMIFKNGALYSNGISKAYGGGEAVQVSDIIQMNGTTDYLELYGNYTSGTSNYVNGAAQASWFSAAYIA